MMLKGIFKNAQLRLFFSGTLFTVAFVWMAMTSYDVSEEEIRVYLILAFILVGGLIGCGLIGSLLLVLFRRRPKDGLLGKLSEIENEVEAQATGADKPRDPGH